MANTEVRMAESPAAALRGKLSERTILILVFATTFLYLFIFRKVTNMDPDEGIVVQGAQRILDGQLPYRDFFSFYTPGSFYLTALLFTVFGDSLLVARTALVFFGAMFPVFTYVLAHRTCSRHISLFVAVLVAMNSAPYRFLVLHNWDSTFWACLSVFCAVRWLESSTWNWAFATGTLASFTFLFEQSKGAGLFLGLTLAFVITAPFGKKFLNNLPILALGAIWPITLTFGYFGSQHALRPMLDAWMWPLHHYSVANRVRYGDQNWSDHARDLLFHTGPTGIRIVKGIAVSPGFVVPVLPLVAVGLLLYWSVRLRREHDSRSVHYVLLCSILSGLLVSVVAVRADVVHFMYLAPLFYLVLAWVLDARDSHSRLLTTLRPYLHAYTATAFGLMGAALLLAALGARDNIETRRGAIRMREKDSVLEYAQAHTMPAEKILVYPYLPLYYYLTATRSASRYEYFQPGMNTHKQAQEVIRSLRSEDVRTVLLETSFANKIPHSWPGTPLSDIARDPIGDYVARNYKACAALKSAAGWDFLYMRRGDLQCP
jgi:hypothetical protein